MTVPKFVKPGVKLYHKTLGKGTVVEVHPHAVIFRVGDRNYILEGKAVADLSEYSATVPQEKREEKEGEKENAARRKGRPPASRSRTGPAKR